MLPKLHLRVEAMILLFVQCPNQVDQLQDLPDLQVHDPSVDQVTFEMHYKVAEEVELLVQ